VFDREPLGIDTELTVLREQVHSLVDEKAELLSEIETLRVIRASLVADAAHLDQVRQLIAPRTPND
jgi:hypothetical protein